VNVLIYGLGALGAIAVFLLPIRCGQLLWSALSCPAKRNRGKMISAIAFVVAWVAWAGYDVISSIVGCFTNSYCGPGVGSVWIYLAFFGLIYVCFELLVQTLQWLLNKGIF